MTDPQDPPKPPIPAGGMTQQLVALVEEVPDDDAGDPNEAPDVGDAALGEGAPITTSKAPPLLPKEKKQVRNRAVIIAVLVFVVFAGLALGAVFVFGGLGQHPVAQPAPPRPPVQPAATSGTGTPAATHAHQPIRLDEFVFTAGADAGAAAPAPPAP